MGDKDINELFGNPELFIGKIDGNIESLGTIVKESITLDNGETIELDRLKVREKALSEPLKIEPIHFECGMPSVDMASLFGFDPAKEDSSTCSLVIEGKPTINKPRNLKYPNKKRARRIWKKWAKRYGTTPSKFAYFPNVEVNCKIASEHDGYLRYDVNAKPIKPIKQK